MYHMTLLQIRNVPEDMRRALKSRAAASGRSLNAYLLDLLRREVARPTVRDVLERAARRAEHSTASAVSALQAARDERHHAGRAPGQRSLSTARQWSMRWPRPRAPRNCGSGCPMRTCTRRRYLTTRSSQSCEDSSAAAI